MNPESEAAAIVGAAGTAALSGGGAGTAPAAGAARQSYPTRPNVAVGNFCPGFTLENYRTRATSSRTDMQLYTMCGQAFDLYNSYLNAIRQGFSEADANRTYAAHEVAARNARVFHQQAR